MSKKDCLIIAHRGESNDAPENTVAALELAWKRGARAVEIDVHLSKDNHVVVFHDFNTRRLSGVNKNVRSQTLQELKALDVGLWKGVQWKGEQIPEINDVLKTVPEGGKLIIEIKSNPKLIPFLEDELKRSTLSEEQVEFIGFDLRTMKLTKEAFPQHKVLWLLDLDYRWVNRIFKPSIKKAIKKVKKYYLDGLNVWAGKMLNESMVRQVHDAELFLYCWTVDDLEVARNLISWRIDAITTNRAQWLKTRLGLP